MRVQVGVAMGAAAVLAASLTTVAPNASAQPLPSLVQDPATSVARTAVMPGAKTGETAGRKAGATAGAKAGKKAGKKAGGARGAKVGETAGRKAGATAGAKAGRSAGAKMDAVAGKKAGAKVGAKAGAKAGASAGKKAAKAAAAPNCGIVVFYKVDGSRWTCTFGDDFNGSSLDTSKWRVMTSDAFNFGRRPDCFVDTPANVSVSDGNLNLTSRRQAASLTCERGNSKYKTQYTAGMVSTYQKYTQAYGRFEFRARFPHTTVNGVQTSAWLWPQGETGATWPASGEIDVAEWYSQWDDRVIPYLHYSSIGGNQATNNNCLVDRVQDWHTYVLEWAPGSITISFDGEACLVNTTIGAPFNKPYMIAMFQAFGLKRNAPTAATPAVNRAQFAWVRAWS